MSYQAKANKSDLSTPFRSVLYRPVFELRMFFHLQGEKTKVAMFALKAFCAYIAPKL